MHTILNLIELSTDYLNNKGVESPRINAELLLAHTLNCKRMDLYLKFDQPLKDFEVNKYREFIKRRGNREPVQYIMGSVEFFGLELIVNKNVLIPRNETEILVETIIKSVGTNKKLKILDIGTGSGNIALSLAKNLSHSFIIGIDNSKYAIEVSKNNSIKNNTTKNIEFHTIDFRNFINKFDEKFDLIVSNPPYVAEEDYFNLEKELKNFEPKDALTDYGDGTTFYRMITSKLDKLLKVNGKIYFEIGFGQSKKVENILKEYGLKNINIIKDYQNIDRVIYGELL